MNNILSGALAFLKGLKQLLFEAPLRSVLGKMLVLLLLLMVLTGATALAAFSYGLEQWLPQGDEWYLQWLSAVLWLLAVLLSLLLAAVMYTLLAAIALAPWLDDLAANAEQPPQHPSEVTLWQSMAQSCIHALMPLLGLLPYALAALMCIFIPFVGMFFAGAIWLWGSLRFLAFELSDTPASRRNMDWPRRKTHVQKNQWFYLGFSGVASLLLVIPVVNILVLPAAVVALSRHIDQLHEGS